MLTQLVLLVMLPATIILGVTILLQAVNGTYLTHQQLL